MNKNTKNIEFNSFVVGIRNIYMNLKLIKEKTMIFDIDYLILYNEFMKKTKKT